MPELPEVETVKRTLEILIKGKTISNVEISWGKIIKYPDDKNEFAMLIQGQTIQAIERRGKFLKFVLDDFVLVSHLRMEGRYGLYDPKEARNKHVHVVFHLKDGSELRYQDVRKFGTMHLFKRGEEEATLPLSQLGVEPFSTDFTCEYLIEKSKRTARKIKAMLLDQTVVVGLGNIYVDEALYRARIRPERIAKDLQAEEYKRLHREIIDTLQEAVEQGGSSIKSYVNGQGEMGMFQQQLNVYGRKNEPCNECGTEINKIVVGGRGTHFCPNCQK